MTMKPPGRQILPISAITGSRSEDVLEDEAAEHAVEAVLVEREGLVQVVGNERTSRPFALPMACAIISGAKSSAVTLAPASAR